MNLRTAIILVACISFISSCSSGGNAKKIVVMSSGKINVDSKDPKTIIFEPGGQHNELEIQLSEADKSVTVKSGGSDKVYEVPENGLYLLSLKSDTMIGNLVNLGSTGRAAHITGDQLQHIIDSTIDLMHGVGASDEKKTYFIIPNSSKKITPNTNAQLLSPYKLIPAKVEVDEKGNPPEMYKFFTNAQKRESLDDLLKRLNK
jgi:hypothetical protein